MITPAHLLFITIFLTALMLVLLVIISFTLLIKNKGTKEKNIWLPKVNLLITKAIFFEAEDESAQLIPIPPRIKKLLTNQRFRQLLIDELVISSKNLAGVASENLLKLYSQLELYKDSEKNLNHFSWYKKVKAIQELSAMKLVGFSNTLYELTNHKNEFIRMEAQTSIVKFHGFEGLSFLNEIRYPISEWHQIHLLKELSAVSSSDFKGIEAWLKSPNDSVIIFALKLSASYHQFHVYDQIIGCLTHFNPKVRLQAINCLKEIYEDTTALHLMKIYINEAKTHQLAILSALREIASHQSTSFLQKQLNSGDNQIKLAAARALLNCGEEGLKIIDKHPGASQYPLNEIFKQIKMESKK
ncbi:HEAT repeat domain-containing protein [Pedobacter sp. P351]|uniref:HEAT repeat domain-containing protein n=1 Tax=Pedobacter superstes TaxID=3133441 RepID=UPI0030B5B173